MKKNNLSASAVLILILAGVLLFGAISGLRLCSVVSGSMEPTIPTWSLCVINTKVDYDAVALGDVVVYKRRSDGKRIIHRVVEITPEGMITKGDANRSDDGVSVGRDNLIGKKLWHIPYLGFCGKIMQYPIVRFGAIGLLILFLLWDISASKKKEKGEENERTDNEKES